MRRKSFPKRKNPIAITIALLALLLGAFAAFKLYTPKLTLPVFDLVGVDPAIANAIREAEAAVKQTPGSGEAWGRLATILAVHDFAAPASLCFTNAERFSPADARWPYLRGLMESGENGQKAMAGFEKAASLCGDLPAPHLRYAEALVERGQTDAAAAQFRFVLKSDSANPRALLGMGRISFAQGKLNESRDYLLRSAQGAPTVKATWSLLGTIEQRLGQPALAEEALAKAATLPEQPEWPDPFLREANRYRTGKVAAGNFAEELLRTGRAAEVIPLMERTVQTYPEFSKGWLMLGKALNQQSNSVRAEEMLQKAVRLEPESVDARVELGSALFAQNKFAEAESSYSEAIRRKPNLAEAWFNLGLARMNQKHPESAIEAFQNATKYKPDLTYAYIRWGQSLGRLNRPAEAIEQINRALQLSPDNAEAKEMLAILKHFQPAKQ